MENNQMEGTQAENKQIVLKKATFGGFEKQSVLDYIYQINNTAQEEQGRLRTQLAEAEAAREQLSASARELESKVSRLENDRETGAAELRSAQKRVGELSALVDTLQTEKAALQAAVGTKDEEIAGHLRLNGELTQENEQVKAHCAVLEANAQEVELATTQIKDALQMARDEADHMVSGAKAQAEAIVAEAKEQAETTVSDANSRAEATISEASQQAVTTLSEANGKAEQTIAEANQKAEAAITDANSQAEATIAAANSQAEDTLAQAKAESEALMAAARQMDQEMRTQLAGLKTGMADARDKLRLVMDEALGGFDRAVDAVSGLDVQVGMEAPASEQGEDSPEARDGDGKDEAQEPPAEAIPAQPAPKERTLSEYFTRTIDFFRSASEDK